MNSENFIKFAEQFRLFDFYKDNYPEMTQSLYGSKNFKDDEAVHFRSNIRDSLAKAKIFEINDEIKKLLCLTNTPIENDEIKIPFEVIFLDVSFTREELEDFGISIKADEIIGITFREGILKGRETKQVGKNLRITMMSLNAKKDIWFDTFNKNHNIDEEYKDFKLQVMENPTTDKIARDFIHKFVLNFLNFLNNPEVEYREHKRSTKNIERRKKQGKPIIPSTFTVRINGKLKLYIDEISRGNKFHFSHRFWVRGHFRTLSSKRYKEKKRIWILPYIKGEGILFDKSYKIK